MGRNHLRGHKLMTRNLAKRLPKLYETEHLGEGNTLVQVKYFTPDSSWEWYVIEFDGEDAFFGLVAGDYVELGYFSLSELEALRGPWKLPVERDLHFKPITLEKLHEQLRKTRPPETLLA